jgi:hypothetical protein
MISVATVVRTTNRGGADRAITASPPAVRLSLPGQATGTTPGATVL